MKAEGDIVYCIILLEFECLIIFCGDVFHFVKILKHLLKCVNHHKNDENVTAHPPPNTTNVSSKVFCLLKKQHELV